MPRLARVEVVQGCPVRMVEVPAAGLEIGRSEEAPLFLDAPSVSKRHARILWDGDDLVVEDLGSTNGVHRDGQVLEGRAVLADGDELVLGEVVLRVAIAGVGTLVDVAQLIDTTSVLEPRKSESGPADVDRRAADLLPVVEQFFHARDLRDLARRVATAVRENLHVSRSALIEIEDAGKRLRVLAVDGATDIGWVSRTVINEAVRRGLALHQLGAVGRPMGGSLVDARSAAAVAAMVRTAGERVRVIYADVLTEHIGQHGVLTWRHAFELQLFAASAASAFEVLQRAQDRSKDRLKFEHLRRHFSASLVEQMSLLSKSEEEIFTPGVMPAVVLFADLSGITRLTERWQARPQALVSLLDLWFELGARAVFAQSGTLDKFVGDGIMAVFGAPFPLDTICLRALRCAGEMQRAVAQLARDSGEQLAFTATMALGPVLAAHAGSRKRREFTVLGETVNRAARMRELTQPADILCDEAAASDLAAVAEFEPVGPIPGGAGAPVSAWRFLRAKDG